MLNILCQFINKRLNRIFFVPCFFLRRVRNIEVIDYNKTSSILNKHKNKSSFYEYFLCPTNKIYDKTCHNSGITSILPRTGFSYDR